MEKKLYVKPGMRVKPLRISGLICQSGGSGGHRYFKSMDTNLDPADEIEVSDNPLSEFGR